MGSGTRPASNNSFQNRLDGPAKWWPICAERIPGLMPTSSTSIGGLTRSLSGGKMARMNWLFKEEPEHYSFDALAKDKSAVWSGVKNPVAQKHLHAVKKGDLIFYYHTG